MDARDFAPDAAHGAVGARRVVRVGCASWAIPRQHAARFPESGTHLERYATRLSAVEVNTSFHGPHAHATYARWSTSVPPDFRFAVKLPREITHTLRLANAEAPLDRFLDQVSGLGEKLGPFLVQLPPSLAYDERTASAFFALLRAFHDAPIVCEPRHASWFGSRPEALLQQHRVARVAADPPPVEDADAPGGWPGVAYFRLHGSPQMYYSEYDDARLSRWAERVRSAAVRAGETWCVFDNTALGKALGNALTMMDELGIARRA